LARILVAALPALPSQGVAKAADLIQLTKADPFEVPGWTSAQLSVLGFHLGMTRQAAAAHAHSLGLALRAEILPGDCPTQAWCDLCDTHDICNGVALQFSDEKVITLQIMEVPKDADPAVREKAVQWNLKGNMYSLLNRYSSQLRVKLLGPGVARDTDLRGGGFFSYPTRGVVLRVNSNPYTLQRDFDITLELMPPVAHQ